MQAFLPKWHPNKAESSGRCMPKTFPVLFENRTKDGFYEGYTPNYTLVRVKSKKDISGEIIETKLVSIENDYCIGEF